MTKREWQLAIPILMGIALCLMGFVHGQRLENAVERITALRVLKATQGEHIAVIANQALHVLDVDGRRLARQDIASLGLSESPNDMDWTVDEHQRMEAWFFDDTVPRVLRCGWNPGLARLTDCHNAMAGPQLKSNTHSRAVHLAVDRVGQRVFIADAKGRRVQVFDLAGKLLTASDLETVPLYFPNRLRYFGNDTLLVADNDNRRLAWLRVAPGQSPTLLRTLYAADHGQARSGRTKVTDAAVSPSGAVWMLAVKQGQKDGDVLVFNGQHQAVARAALPDGADPLFIDSLGDAALVADYALVNVVRIDAQGHNLGEFGDTAFRGELAPLAAQIREGALWKTIALVCGGVILAAGFVLGWRYGEKPKRPGQFDQHALAALVKLGDGDGGRALHFPVRLKQTVAYRAWVKKTIGLVALLITLMASMAVVSFLLIEGSVRSLGTWTLPVVLIMGMVLAAPTFWWVWREHFQAIELRVSEHKVECFRNGQLVSAAPLKEVHASTHALLIGSKTIRFRSPVTGGPAGPAMFDVDLFERAVLSRLPPQNLVNDQALAWLAFKRSRAVYKLLAGALLGAALGFALYANFR